MMEKKLPHLSNTTRLDPDAITRRRSEWRGESNNKAIFAYFSDGGGPVPDRPLEKP
jgi:hypothetical protein